MKISVSKKHFDYYLLNRNYSAENYKYIFCTQGRRRQEKVFADTAFGRSRTFSRTVNRKMAKRL